MSHITIQDVEKTARLAKLQFSEEEKQVFAGSFNKIVGLVEQIAELNTDDVAPTTHAVEKQNVTRPDVVQPSLTIEEIEAVAPQFMENSIVVPKVIDH